MTVTMTTTMTMTMTKCLTNSECTIRETKQQTPAQAGWVCFVF